MKIEAKQRLMKELILAASGDAKPLRDALLKAGDSIEKAEEALGDEAASPKVVNALLMDVLSTVKKGLKATFNKKGIAVRIEPEFTRYGPMSLDNYGAVFSVDLTVTFPGQPYKMVFEYYGLPSKNRVTLYIGLIDNVMLTPEGKKFPTKNLGEYTFKIGGAFSKQKYANIINKAVNNFEKHGFNA